MKKSIKLAISAIILLTLAGCSNHKDSSVNSSDKSSSSQTQATSKQNAEDSSVSTESSTNATLPDDSTSKSETTTKASSTSSASSLQDLDVKAINNGDFSSLIGTWKNGKGDTLVIHSDGSTNLGDKITPVKDSDKVSKVPYANLSSGSVGGAALGLFQIGFKNPDGDQSDTSKPRLVITQNSGNYDANLYYYRQP